MSRVGRLPIAIPAGVTVTVTAGNLRRFYKNSFTTVLIYSTSLFDNSGKNQYSICYNFIMMLIFHKFLCLFMNEV